MLLLNHRVISDFVSRTACSSAVLSLIATAASSIEWLWQFVTLGNQVLCSEYVSFSCMCWFMTDIFSITETTIL